MAPAAKKLRTRSTNIEILVQFLAHSTNHNDIETQHPHQVYGAYCAVCACVPQGANVKQLGW